MSPSYTKGDRKLVRKPIEEVYGNEDDQTITTLSLTPWQNIWYNHSRGDEYNQTRSREEDLTHSAAPSPTF